MIAVEAVLAVMACLMLSVAVAEMNDSNDAAQVQLSLLGVILALGFLGLMLHG